MSARKCERMRRRRRTCKLLGVVVDVGASADAGPGLWFLKARGNGIVDLEEHLQMQRGWCGGAIPRD